MSAEEKNTRFEHDPPSEIEVEADASDPTEDGDEPDFEKAMAWEGYEDQPLLKQVGRIAALTRFGTDQFDFAAGLQKEGIPDDLVAFDFRLGMMDVQVLSLALNIVGFFADGEFADHAKIVMERLDAENDAVVLTEEQEKQIEEASEALRERAWAAMLGITVEEYREAKQSAAEAAEKKMLDNLDASLTGEDGKINLN